MATVVTVNVSCTLIKSLLSQRGVVLAKTACKCKHACTHSHILSVSAVFQIWLLMLVLAGWPEHWGMEPTPFHTLSREWKRRILQVSLFFQLVVCYLGRFPLCSIFWPTMVSLLVSACAFSQPHVGCCPFVRQVAYCSYLFYTEDWMSWAVTGPFSSARSYRLAVQHTRILAHSLQIQHRLPLIKT